jgi:teichuronic acid biosynthesis glycosyltransferase TuaC
VGGSAGVLSWLRPRLLLVKPQPDMRVLAVIPGDGAGASMIFTRRQVESLARQALDVRTFYLNSRMSLVGLAQEWCRLRREIRSYQPHMVHAHYGTVTAFLCAMATSRPLVVTFRGSDLNSHPEIGFLRARVSLLLSQIAARRAAQVICVSGQLQSRLWSHRERAIVLPDGVDLDLFHPSPKPQARARLGWQADVPTVVFNTSTQPRAKGIELVKAAIRVAEQRVARIHLALLDGTVPPRDVPLYLSAADCVALASFREGSPNIVKEALACNLPVVSVDVGDVAERLKGVYPSRVVQRDPVEFGNALADIVAAGVRSNGREVVAECSETSVAERIRGVYERIMYECHEPD